MRLPWWRSLSATRVLLGLPRDHCEQHTGKLLCSSTHLTPMSFSCSSPLWLRYFELLKTMDHFPCSCEHWYGHCIHAPNQPLHRSYVNAFFPCAAFHLLLLAILFSPLTPSSFIVRKLPALPLTCGEPTVTIYALHSSNHQRDSPTL
jgi:hypothetical protein